jgi:hypothetical protein
MESDAAGELEWGRRDRILGALDRMVESGRITENEAQDLRAASDERDFNQAVRNIRVRHAGAQLDQAVAGGSLTRAEADHLVERLQNGEHGGSLRARLRGLRAHGRHRG